MASVRPRCFGSPDARQILRLQPGEYAIHEGDGRALYVLLEGHLETTKLIDGIERVIGGREQGELVGEVPMVLATPFPASFRATVPTRLMRIDPREYHAVAAVAPDVSARVGAHARDRLSGLQEIAAAEPAPQATVVGYRYDKACRDLRTFLDRNGVSFEWIIADEAQGDAHGVDLASIDGRFPAVVLRNGSLLVQPERRELADRLGLTTVPSAPEYDTVIIGGGPAGLAAAVYGASEGLSTVMIENEAPGGQAGTSSAH